MYFSCCSFQVPICFPSIQFEESLMEVHIFYPQWKGKYRGCCQREMHSDLWCKHIHSHLSVIFLTFSVHTYLCIRTDSNDAHCLHEPTRLWILWFVISETCMYSWSNMSRRADSWDEKKVHSWYCRGMST